MKTPGPIQHLKRRQLNTEKWDACISRAGNGLIYGYSFYLDAMADDWDALVLNDYEAVMPLPWRKKWGIAYLYQPFLTAQLGVFGNQMSAEKTAAFMNAVPRSFRYWDFPLNHQNRFPLSGYLLHERMNYVLPLQPSYEALFRGYRENIRRNLRKSQQYGCQFETGIALDRIFALTRLQAKELSPHDIQSFTEVFTHLSEKGLAKTCGIVGQNGELLASAAFLFSHHRAYYLLVGNHPNGRTLGASHALIDGFIQLHAGQPLLLDFEGSDIRNLAFFYSSFGALSESYAAIRLNRLPWWGRWLKPS